MPTTWSRPLSTVFQSQRCPDMSQLVARRERRREELARQRALTIQDVERTTSVLILPHPERKTPGIRQLQPDPETERIAMELAIDFERKARQHSFQ